MGKVIHVDFGQRVKQTFTIDTLNELMPLVVRITKEHNSAVQQLISAIDASPSDAQVNLLEEQTNALISSWQRKIEQLGGKTKGLWIADFDSGDGYFCWKYPEEEIIHWHGYKDGFSGRIPVEEYLNRKEVK